jgi:hypothetical protein
MEGGKYTMKRINGTLYYSIREIAIILNKDYQTILRYFTVSQRLRASGKKGLLPEPMAFGKGHYYSEAQVRQFKETVRGFKRGTFAGFGEKKTTYQRIKEENERLKKKIKELETGVR